MAELKLDLKTPGETFLSSETGWLAVKFVSGTALSVSIKKVGDNSVGKLTRNNAIYINGTGITLSIEDLQKEAILEVYWSGTEDWLALYNQVHW